MSVTRRRLLPVAELRLSESRMTPRTQNLSRDPAGSLDCAAMTAKVAEKPKAPRLAPRLANP